MKDWQMGLRMYIAVFLLLAFFVIGYKVGSVMGSKEAVQTLKYEYRLLGLMADSLEEENRKLRELIEDQINGNNP